MAKKTRKRLETGKSPSSNGMFGATGEETIARMERDEAAVEESMAGVKNARTRSMERALESFRKAKAKGLT